MASRKVHRLERVLGPNALFASAYGNVGSSIYYALGLVASLALGLTPLVFVISGVIFYLTAATYAEATTMYPEAGGSSSFARHAFNETVSFGAAWMQAMNFIVTAAISALFVPHYLGFIWAPLRHSPWDIVGAAVVIGLLCLLNIRGVQEAAKLNIAMAVADFMTQVALVLGGVFLVFNPHILIHNIHFGVAPSLKDFLVAIPVGMIAYTGIETVSNMSEEARDAGTTVPKAINRVVGAVAVIYAALPAIALSALPVHKDAHGHYVTLLGLDESKGGFAGDPILGVVKQMHLGFLQAPVQIYVGLLAATILILATNAGLFGVSRLIYSMGQYRQVPEVVRKLHPKYRTPYIGLIFCSLIAGILLFGPAAFLGNLYAAMAMMSFTIAHLAVIRMRVNRKDQPRPYRIRAGTIRWRGSELPAPAMVGALGTGIAFFVVVVLHPAVAAVGAVWLALGMVGYRLYRGRLGIPMSKTAKVAIPDPVTESEVEYQSILVAANVSQDCTQALATAKALAAAKQRGVYLHLTVTVPRHLPLDAPFMGDQEAKRLVAQAKKLVGRRLAVRISRVRPGEAARAILAEARAIEAKAIIMPMPSARTHHTHGLFGKTIERVLEQRPCRVILTEPVTNRVGQRRIKPPLLHLTSKDAREAPPVADLSQPAFNAVLVPVFADPLDDDIMQTAGRLAAESIGKEQSSRVEALAVVEVPVAEPLEAGERLPSAKRLTQALTRAQAVGEEYNGVRVHRHLVCARQAGQAIVAEAERLGVQAIVLAAEDMRAVAGGTHLGGIAKPTGWIGKITTYVMTHAPCAVVLTTPTVDEEGGERDYEGDAGAEMGPEAITSQPVTQLGEPPASPAGVNAGGEG